MTVGEKICNLRTASNMSQEEFAEKIGVSRQSVSKWENGFVTPDTDFVVKICTLFGVTADELLMAANVDRRIAQLKRQNAAACQCDEPSAPVAQGKRGKSVFHLVSLLIYVAVMAAAAVVCGVIGMLQTGTAEELFTEGNAISFYGLFHSYFVAYAAWGVFVDLAFGWVLLDMLFNVGAKRYSKGMLISASITLGLLACALLMPIYQLFEICVVGEGSKESLQRAFNEYFLTEGCIWTALLIGNVVYIAFRCRFFKKLKGKE